MSVWIVENVKNVQNRLLSTHTLRLNPIYFNSYFDFWQLQIYDGAAFGVFTCVLSEFGPGPNSNDQPLIHR